MDIMPTWPAWSMSSIYVWYMSSSCDNQWSPPHIVIQQTIAKDGRATYSWSTYVLWLICDAYQWCTDAWYWMTSCFPCYSYRWQVKLLWFQERLLYKGYIAIYQAMRECALYSRRSTHVSTRVHWLCLCLEVFVTMSIHCMIYAILKVTRST